jgi:two-component system cell cycle sensor histidine kinase/response regulator CckA
MDDYGSQTREGAFDELPLGIWVARAPTGDVLYTNQAFRTIMGMEAVGSADIAAAPAVYGIFDREGKLYPVENLPFSVALARGEPVVVDDLVIHRGDGSRVWVRAFANPVRDAQGVVRHVVIAFTDITAEVKAVVERAEIEKHLAVAIHHAPVLLFMMDRDAVLTTADGALRDVLERGRGAMVGRSLLQTYKDHPTVPGNIRRALAGETVSYSLEVQGLVLDVWLGPVRDAAGALAGAIGVCTDVTESRRLQTRIIQDDRIRAMGTMAASVAHEINNPLTYVLAGLEEANLELEGLSTDLGALMGPQGNGVVVSAALNRIGRLREYLAPALAGTQRIRQVTSDLRTFTRPNDERLAPIAIDTIVRSVLKLVGKEIEARASLVEEIGVSPVVLANEARLVQVLVNLLMNAWQALPAADPAHQVIGVRTGTHDSQALIEIWDSGPGVPSQLREQVFEPFVTTKDVGTGTGLGLFVCRNIIRSLRGQITAHDAPGGGALFRIVLPPTTQPALVPAAAPAVGAGPKSSVRRARILIIDDDAIVAGALASRFAADAFDVRTVFDGRQGLDILLTDDRLDLAYCDIMMKDFSGIDLHEALQRQSPGRLSKVVFMTGGAFTGEAQAFMDRRGDALVQKPFDILADARRRVG